MIGLSNKCRYYKSKVTYETEAEAKRVAKKRRKRFGVKLVAYKCRYCDFWHIGHVRSKAQVKRKIKAMEEK